MRLRVPRVAFFILLWVGVAVLSPRVAYAGESDLDTRGPAFDPLFPGALRGAVAVASGVPFVAMGELSLGLSDRFSLGALFGATPVVYALGGRPRVLLLDRPRFRVSIVAPFLYYPEQRNVQAPWLLARPSLQFAPRISQKLSLFGGVGLVAAATMARLARERGVEDYSDGAGGFRGYETGRPFTAGIWWTLSAGGVISLGERCALFGDVALVFEKLGLASSAWVGGPPVMATLGLSTRI
jgi:hypothetical protein